MASPSIQQWNTSYTHLSSLYALYKLQVPEYSDELMKTWKMFIHGNREFCLSGRIHDMHVGTFKLEGTVPVPIRRVLMKQHTHDTGLETAQLMRKVYNNMVSDESDKIRVQHSSSSSTVSTHLANGTSQSSYGNGDDDSKMDPAWMMNVAAVLMQVYQQHTVTPELIMDCMPDEVKRALDNGKRVAGIHAAEEKMDVIEVAHEMLNDPECKQALKAAFPKFTQTHLKGTITEIIQVLQKRLKIVVPSDGSGGLPPMMATLLSMMNQ